jgi:hypothetical protein
MVNTVVNSVKARKGSKIIALALGVGGVLVIALTLATVFTAVLLPFLGQGSGPLSAATPRSTTIASIQATQAAAALTATDASGVSGSGSSDWYTFADGNGGFQIDVPGVIGSSHGYFINDFSGMGADFTYGGAPLTTPLERREAQLFVSIQYSTKITDRNICPQGGVAVLIGSGNRRIPALVRDEGPVAALNLVLNGRAIQVILNTNDANEPALTAYGDVWQHMLASFAPLPSARPLSTHPCG